MGGSRGELGRGSRPPPGKLQVAICFLGNSSTDQPGEATGPPIASRERSVRPSVKYVDDKKSCQDPAPQPPPQLNFLDPPTGMLACKHLRPPSAHKLNSIEMADQWWPSFIRLLGDILEASQSVRSFH